MTFFRPAVWLALSVFLAISSIISHAKELKVGIGMVNYPPFYFDEDGLMAGAVIEISQLIAEKLGHKLLFEQYPWPRIQSYLREGKIDMVILYFKTPERETYAIYTDTPHIYDTSYLFTNKDADIQFNGDLSNLSNYYFGNVRGYSHGKKYDNILGLIKQEAGDEKQLINMLLKKRIDIAVGNKAVINNHAQKEGVLDKIDFLTPPLDITPAYFAFAKVNKDSVLLADEFSNEIKKLITTKKYQLILQKHGVEAIQP